MRRIATAIAAAAATTVGTVATVGAAEAPTPTEPAGVEHCVVHASGVDEDGVLIVSEPVCGSERLATSMLNSSAMSRSTTYTLGRHFSSTSYGGSSITITGSVPCGGGVWKPTGFWNNNIESSIHYCGSSGTRFYDSSSCSGSVRTIFSSTSSLGSMNNRASCVRYG
ncbi:MAG: hypothetical protein AAGA17_05735 [Actinomycetota bacterium]